MTTVPSATRTAAKEEIVRLLADDERVVCVDTDTGLFSAADVEQIGERYLNVGIAEHAAVSVGAGLARDGLRPVVCMFAAFAVNRAADAVKIDVAYADLPVCLVGTHAGLSAGFLGPTHHCLEDVALMRSLPGMTVVAPGDAGQVAPLLGRLLTLDGPSYLRLGRRPSPVLPEATPPPSLGHLQPLPTSSGPGTSVVGRPGREVTVFTYGPEQLATALHVAEDLRSEAEVGVVNVHTLKPLSEASVVDLLPAPDGLVVTLEEHWRSGGLGDAIADVVTAHAPRRMLRIAVPDAFCGTPGPHDFQLSAAGLDATSVSGRIRATWDQATSLAHHPARDRARHPAKERTA